MPVLILQRLILEFLIDIIYFPLWWYSKGALRIAHACMELVRYGNVMFVPMLWAQNIFTPMFGQRDWQGRLVSIFMRLVNVMGRSLAFGVWSVVVLTMFVLWLIAPLGIVAAMVIALVP